MEKLNYFTDEVGSPELKNYFESLNEENLKYELENFTNQYLNLSKEEQLKHAGNVLSICIYFDEIIGKFTTKNILVILNKILLENRNLFTWYENFKYLHVLYLYLWQTKEYEECSIFFENESYFFRILELVVNDDLVEGFLLDYHILPVFFILFLKDYLPKDSRIYFKRELESYITFLFENHNIHDLTYYWYFNLDKLVAIFKIEHLETISNFYINNTQSDDVGEYLNFVSRHFDVVIANSIDVIRKIAEENDSDIIRNQAIKLIEKYDNDYLNEKSDSESISSLDADQLLEQADKIIYYIRSKYVLN